MLFVMVEVTCESCGWQDDPEKLEDGGKCPVCDSTEVVTVSQPWTKAKKAEFGELLRKARAETGL